MRKSRKLRPYEPCPLHKGNRFCCGREKHRSQLVKDVTVLGDGRVICSDRELERRKAKLIADHPYCAVCERLDPRHAKFTDFHQIHLGHRESKGMGGAKRNDGWDNLVLLHAWENVEMGSMSLDAYLTAKILRQQRGTVVA